jgi:alcohol dehydrogenase, propanol-preferring
MRAMALTRIGAGRLTALDLPRPTVGPGEVLVQVAACGVCRTDLHIVDGELLPSRLPVVPGHEIVGRVVAVGRDVAGLSTGARVGIAWIAGACGRCDACATGRENLCRGARFTGCDRDGGYAEYAVADARFAFPLPDVYDDEHAAPLLCAGVIGYRAYRMAGPGRRLGIYGFGAAAHILAQLAVHDGREVYAFTRPGDSEGAAFARELGVAWAGGSDQAPPERLDASILFAPVGALVPEALSHTVPGGVVVCAGIHMSDIPAFAYRLLWEERIVRSVANLTRQDATDFLQRVSSGFIRTRTSAYPLARANDALDDVRAGRVTGAAVLLCAAPTNIPQPA